MATGLEDTSHDSASVECEGEVTAAADAPYIDKQAWVEFQRASSPEAFAAAWLELLCRFTGGVQHAAVVLGKAGVGPYRPLAYWPVGGSGSPLLVAAAELAMAERRGVVRSSDSTTVSDRRGPDAVAFPIVVDELLHGVAAVEVKDRDSTELGSIMRQLQWSCGWLEALVRRKAFTSKERLVTLLELIAVPLEQASFRAAVTALATELATHLDCEWAALGFGSGRRVRVSAWSHSAAINEKTNLHRSIGAAMDEAIEQARVLVSPAPDQSEASLVQIRAQTQLLEQATLGGVCTIPLVDGDRLVGAMTLARPLGQSFDQATVELCRNIATLAGPILEVKRRDDRWIVSKLWDSVVGFGGRLIGPRHLGLKLAATLLTCVAAYAYFAEGDYRVTADAHLQGSIQRVVTALLDGYVDQAFYRAGDVVQAGDVLCTLEDKDLRLQRAKWASQKEQRQREYSEALADRDRAQVRVLQAQIDQADSQLLLLDEQLARTRLKAPFDGVVVSGDMSQSLGVPVARGDTLFEIAPLNSYRVILNVDERDASQVQPGQVGQLVLAGLSTEILPMRITKITPISSAKGGGNYFRVEANLEGSSSRLRPGMEGVGKIQIGQRKQVWIWTHKLIHWLRFWLWSWKP